MSTSFVMTPIISFVLIPELNFRKFRQTEITNISKENEPVMSLFENSYPSLSRVLLQVISERIIT